MNYIARLRAEVADLEAENAALRDGLAEFQLHLASSKFRGTDPDGDRRDWIATADVSAWIARVLARAFFL